MVATSAAVTAVPAALGWLFTASVVPYAPVPPLKYTCEMARRSPNVLPPRRYWQPWPNGKLTSVTRAGRDASAVLGPVVASIIEAREWRGWSRSALAERAGVTQQTVWNVETGNTWPDFVTLVGLSTAVGLDVTVLVNPGRKGDLRASAGTSRTVRAHA